MPKKARKVSRPRRLDPAPLPLVEGPGARAVSMDGLIGRNVAHWRRSAGLSRPEVASSMARIGFAWHTQTLEQIENGIRRLAWDELLVLAAYFAVSPFELLGASGRVYPVAVRDNVITSSEWMAFWQGETPAALAHAVARLDRPWMRSLESGAGLEEAYKDAREEVLAKRTRYPGPTFVADESDVALSSGVVDIKLAKGVPYVARDDFEAEALLEIERQRKVRRVSNQQAYKIRKRMESAEAKRRGRG